MTRFKGLEFGEASADLEPDRSRIGALFLFLVFGVEVDRGREPPIAMALPSDWE